MNRLFAVTAFAGLTLAVSVTVAPYAPTPVTPRAVPVAAFAIVNELAPEALAL